MRIDTIEEFKIDQSLRQSVSQLIKSAFEGYPDEMTYYNQVPDFRILVWDGDQLIGHSGIHHRRICVDKMHRLSVFGIADLCIHPQRQLKNVGSEILKHVTDLAEKNEVDFLILASGAEEFYLKNDFFTVHNPCRWLVIHNHESMGVFRRTLPSGLLVKSTSEVEWPSGEVDFMGHMM